WETVGIAQITVAVCTVLIVWQIGKRWLTPTIGLLAALAVALHPYLIWHDVHMNREILDQLLAAALTYLTLHAAERFGWRRAAMLGAVLGLAILGNVRLAALPFLIGAYLLFRSGTGRRALLACAAMLAAAGIVVAPWLVRNRADVGCWAITTDARALWKANNSGTYATLERGGWIDNVPIPKSFPRDPQDIYFHWTKTGVVIPYSECAQMTSYEHKVTAFWIHHPGEKAKLVPVDLQWLWQPTVVETASSPGAGSWVGTLRSTVEPVYMIAVYVLALVGLFLVSRAFAAFAVLMLAYQSVAAMIFVGVTRYRVPWDFLLDLLAATALVAIVPRIRARFR
ncbi:MAG TPA: glycosyltransferase family 39 protein, partial [Gaiellaceae bacterium]